MNTTLLVTQAPAETLLGLLLFFIFSATILVALAAEAGHYRDLNGVMRTLQRKLCELRPRRRWLFNTGIGEQTKFSAGSSLTH